MKRDFVDVDAGEDGRRRDMGRNSGFSVSSSPALPVLHTVTLLF